ncbi:MAG: uroporphyrinogen-III C-methyltransferase [Candidatus Aureabacteria bacterium]|nr:uroporphyrinogen-III C-methyltransferase [Candidatus Auribacterota bacterium]
MKRCGTVYLVGAGPGDPGLITEKGKEMLGAADTVFYDHLVSPALLACARPGAKCVSVGKIGGGRRTAQEAINRMLVAEARRGRRVVRLKGGDPILFARGAEEALYCATRHIHCEIVPGVSAAIAVPTVAGVPLTLRGMSSSVTILTGHEADLGAEGGVDWKQLLRADSTFIVLMGVKRLEEIARRFLAAGKPPATRAILIEQGTTPFQRVVRGPLGRIAQIARRARVAAPAVLVVGRVAGVRRMPLSRARMPLRGMRILVTRPRDQARSLVQLLDTLGAVPYSAPLIEIRPPRSCASLDRAVSGLGRYDWIIFTSANGVRAFMERLGRAGRDCRALGRIRICAIGPATAGALANCGVMADCVPRAFTSRGIVHALRTMGEVGGKRFLLPRSDLAGRELTDALTRRGGRCTDVVAYRTVTSARGILDAARIMREERIDCAVLTSPSAVDAYVRSIRRVPADRRPSLAAIGPVTAAAARKRGLRVAVSATVHTDEGLARAIANRGKKKGAR